MEPSLIFGWVASISMVMGYIPQTIQTVRTRKTDDIAMGTFLLMGLGGLCFAIQGWLIGNWPLFTCSDSVGHTLLLVWPQAPARVGAAVRGLVASAHATVRGQAMGRGQL